MDIKKELRQLYKDALYYHFLHNNFTMEKAKLKVEQIYNSYKEF